MNPSAPCGREWMGSAAGLAAVSQSSSGELALGATPEAMRLRRSADGHPAPAIAAALGPALDPWRTDLWVTSRAHIGNA